MEKTWLLSLRRSAHSQIWGSAFFVRNLWIQLQLQRWNHEEFKPCLHEALLGDGRITKRFLKAVSVIKMHGSCRTICGNTEMTEAAGCRSVIAQPSISQVEVIVHGKNSTRIAWYNKLRLPFNWTTCTNRSSSLLYTLWSST